MTESNAPKLQEEFMSAVTSLDQSAYEIYYLAEFFLKRSAQHQELITLWYNALRLDKPRRCALLYTANEVIVRVTEQSEGSEGRSYIEGFGVLLEDLTHFLGGDRDAASLQCLLKVLQVWERFPRAFLRDYLRLVALLAEDYLAAFLANSPEGLKVTEFPLTRKLQEATSKQAEFALYKSVCDEDKQGRVWVFQSCRKRCLETVETLAAVLMQMSRQLEEEFALWTGSEQSH